MRLRKGMKKIYLWWWEKKSHFCVFQTVSVRSWQKKPSDSEARFCTSPEGGTSLSQSRTYVPVGLVREKTSLSLQLLPPPPPPLPCTILRFPRGGVGLGLWGGGPQERSVRKDLTIQNMHKSRQNVFLL